MLREGAAQGAGSSRGLQGLAGSAAETEGLGEGEHAPGRARLTATPGDRQQFGSAQGRFQLPWAFPRSRPRVTIARWL